MLGSPVRFGNDLLLEGLHKQATILMDNKYTVLKVSTWLSTFSTATDREIGVYEHLSKVRSSHPCQSLIREFYDSFHARGRVGNHHCLVLMTLLEIMGYDTRPFDLPLLKMTVKRLLLALDFLHTVAGVIHIGITACSDVAWESRF